MSQRSTTRPGVPMRRGEVDWMVKLLLAAILIVLVVLLGVILWPHGAQEESKAPEKSKVAVHSGQKVTRTPEQPKPPPEVGNPSDAGSVKQHSLPEQPKSPPEVGNPDRIREVLQVGKTYQVITTADLNAPVRDQDWGVQRTVYLAYRAEVAMRRYIEKNDGNQVVELRTIEAARMVKATSTVRISFNWTSPGVLLLGGLDWILTGGQITAITAATLKPMLQIAEDVLQAQLDQTNLKAKAMLDSLNGKKVRITYEDGRGVTALEPVDCDLTEEERDFLFGLAVIGDVYLLPNFQSKPGDVWDVPGEAFSDFLPPSWRGAPRGKISIQREEDFTENGQRYARLRIVHGSIRVDATDASRTRLAHLTPRGNLKYNITAGHVESAEITAEGSVEEASRDHLLFEARFETQPKLRFTYACKIINPSSGR